jgi:putative DNA methylase
VLQAGFRLVQAQPVKAEMSVAMPKLAARSPIDLDVLMVCRKAATDRRPRADEATALDAGADAAAAKVRRFNATGRHLSLNDVRIVVYSQALVELSAGRGPAEVLDTFERSLEACAAVSQRLFIGQDQQTRTARVVPTGQPIQASLF